MSFINSPPSLISSNFNPSFFNANTTPLTLTTGDSRYVKTNGSAIVNSLLSNTTLGIVNNNSTAITSTTGCEQYGLCLRSNTASNAQMAGAAIAFQTTTNSFINPLASIILDRKSTSQGELVLNARNGSALSESLRLNSIGAITPTINVNNGTMQSQATIKGSSTYISGVSQRIITCQDSTEAIKCDIQIGNSNVYIGSYTNHDTYIQSNNTGRLVVKAGGQVGIGSNCAQAGNSLSLLDGADGTSTSLIQFGNSYTSNNSTGIQWTSFGNGDARNSITFNHYGGSNDMVLNCQGRMGLGGTVFPSAFLDISGGVSQTIAAGGGTYAQLLPSSSNVNLLGPLSSVLLSANFGQAVKASAFYAASDKRLKYDIKELPETYCDDFYKISSVSYKWKHLEENQLEQIGFIAQDFKRLGYGHLLMLTDNENLKAENDDDIDKCQMSIDYSRVSVLNHQMIKKLLKRISDLENIIQSIQNYGPLKKFLDKKT